MLLESIWRGKNFAIFGVETWDTPDMGVKCKHTLHVFFNTRRCKNHINEIQIPYNIHVSVNQGRDSTNMYTSNINLTVDQ